MGQLDSGHGTIEIIVCDEGAQLGSGCRDNQFGGFRSAAFNHLETLILQCGGEHVSLEYVVLHQEDRELGHMSLQCIMVNARILEMFNAGQMTTARLVFEPIAPYGAAPIPTL
jgi:hypothetical protein